MIHWNADPILLQLGPVAIHWYGVLFAGGFLIGYQLDAMDLPARRLSDPNNSTSC